MSNTNAVKKASPAKEILNGITKKIETALADLKQEMGEKRFNKAVKKAGKLFAAGVKKSKVKKAAKKSVKKAAAKSVTKKAPSKRKTPVKKAKPANTKNSAK